MRRRLASASWLESADRLAGGFFAVFAGGGALAEAAGAPTWLAITLAAIGVAGSVLLLVLNVLHERAKRMQAAAALLARPPLRVSAALDSFYELGVDFEARESLDLLGIDVEHAPYVERDVDAELRRALREAAGRHAATLIVLSGRSKTGKSRTLLEAAAAELKHAWLLIPREPSALPTLARSGAPRQTGEGPSIVWLDDLEPWAKPGDQGLNAQTLDAFGDWRQPVLILAAEGGKGVELAGAEATRFGEVTSDLLARARHVRVYPEVSTGEAARLREHFSETAVRRIQDEGIGEFMIAAPRLIARLETEQACLEGPAVVWAAIDCRRTGLLRALPADWLEALYGHYLPTPTSAEAFQRGVAWATKPLYATTALLSAAQPGPPAAFEPYDYLVDHAQRRRRPIEPAVWDRVVDEYADGETELLRVSWMAYLFATRGHAVAVRAAQRADALGSADGATRLGVLLRQRLQSKDAEAAFRRGHERGSPHAAVELGFMYQSLGDLEAAEAAYKLADAERDSAEGAFRLGELLERRGDREGAEGAYRRADARGDALGALALAELLDRRGDLEEALGPYGRAEERSQRVGDEDLVVQAGGAAADAYRRADDRGSSIGAFKRGRILEQWDIKSAEAAYRRARERATAAGDHDLVLEAESALRELLRAAPNNPTR